MKPPIYLSKQPHLLPQRLTKISWPLPDASQLNPKQRPFSLCSSWDQTLWGLNIHNFQLLCQNKWSIAKYGGCLKVEHTVPAVRMSWSSPSKWPCVGIDAIIGQAHAVLLAISYHIPAHSNVFPQNGSYQISYPSLLLIRPMSLVTSHISAPCPRNSHLHLLHPHWRPPPVSPPDLLQQKKGLHDEWYWNVWELQTCPNIGQKHIQNPEHGVMFFLLFIKWSLDHVGSCWLTLLSLEMSHNIHNQSSNTPSLLLDRAADVQQVHLEDHGGWNPWISADEMETCHNVKILQILTQQNYVYVCIYIYIYNYIYIGENTYNRCFVCIQQLLGRSEVGSFNRRGTVKVTVSPGGMYGGTPSSPWLTLLAELDGNRVKLDVWDLYPQITVSRGEIMINHEENVGVP